MRVSYSASALKTFTACQQKYVHRYVLETPVDIDYKPSEAVNLGSAYHKLLELTDWSDKKYTPKLLVDVCEQYKLVYNDDGAKLAAMLRAFWAVRDTTESCLAKEINVSKDDTQKVIIDAVIQKSNNDWYICDAKTTSKLCEFLPHQLKTDIQMQLYHSFYPEIAELLQLSPDKYKGILYRQFKKPLQVYKEGESFESYTQRCKADYREIKVYPDCNKDFKAAVQGVNLLLKDATAACKNHSNCFAYHSKCEYFNTCHGVEVQAAF
jgi:hypothetical protein